MVAFCKVLSKPSKPVSGTHLPKIVKSLLKYVSLCFNVYTKKLYYLSKKNCVYSCIIKKFYVFTHVP